MSGPLFLKQRILIDKASEDPGGRSYQPTLPRTLWSTAIPREIVFGARNAGILVVVTLTAATNSSPSIGRSLTKAHPTPILVLRNLNLERQFLLCLTRHLSKQRISVPATLPRERVNRQLGTRCTKTT